MRGLALHLAMPTARRQSLLLCCLLLWSLVDSTAMAATVSVGAGIQRMPAWPGARTHRSDPLPYLDVEWSDYGSLSTQDGLHLDLLRGKQLHGGVYAYYQWGRDHDDLGNLAGRLPTLAPRATLGGYLEWQLDQQIDVGANLAHDINGAGTYLNVYAEWDLPTWGEFHQSLVLDGQAMTGPAMRRFFGVTTTAAALHIPASQPGGGSQLASPEYDAFMPVSQHAGFAASLGLGRLLGNAAASPLVRSYGSRMQLSESLAFIWRFSDLP
jgi:hypothetical protein